jgi:outer membrane protein assembly factor BamB
MGYEPGMTVWSSPAIGEVNGRAVLLAGSYDRNVYAFDAAGGEVLWRFTTGGAVLGTPILATQGGVATVFAASSDRIVYALDAADGRRRWSRAVEDYRPTLGGARLAAPALGRAKGRAAVFVAHWVFDRSLAGSLQRGGVTALDAETGAVIWRSALSDNEMTAPVYAELRGRALLFVGSSTGSVYALDAESGAVAWRHAELDAVRSPPALLEEGGPPLLLAASKYGTLRALEATTGEVLWSHRTADRITGSPAIAAVAGRPVALVGSLDGSLHAVESRTGRPLWQRAVRAGIYGSPCLAGALAIAPAWDHRLHAVGVEGGEALWSVHVGRPLWDAIAQDESTWSSPAAARVNGRWMAYFGSYDGRLYALPIDELRSSGGPVAANLAFWISFPLALAAAGGLAVLLTRRARRHAGAGGAATPPPR